jgi:hypothetical protein
MWLAGLLRFDLFLLLGEVFRTARSGQGCAVRRSEASLECEDGSEIVGQQGKGKRVFRCSFILLSSIKWRFSFRQLRSYRCSDLFVGSHISAFSFCTSQFRERVSQSKISLKGLWPGSALTRASTKVGCNLLPQWRASALIAVLDRPPALSKPNKQLRPSAGRPQAQLSENFSCA